MLNRGTSTFQLHDITYKYRGGMIPVSVEGGKATKIDYSPTEGFQVWYEQNKYPVNGWLDPITLAQCDIVKREIRIWVKFISHFPVVLFSSWFRGWWQDQLDALCFRCLKGYFFLPQHYSRSVKEFYSGMEGWKENIRDAVATILEQDRPYRYALQDVLPLIDKQELNRNAGKELARVFKILVKRSKAIKFLEDGNIALMITLGIRIAMLFPRIRNTALNALNRMDLKKVALDTADKYNAYLSDAYDYDGLCLEQRLELHKLL